MPEFWNSDGKVFDLSLVATKLEDSPNLELNGAEQSAARLTGLDPESCCTRAVQVRGSRNGICEGLLQLLFETGGDVIETLDYNAEEGIAIIICKDADSA